MDKQELLKERFKSAITSAIKTISENFDIEELRLTYNCKNYFETGLFDPRCNVSVKQALKCNFNKVFSIEIRDDWVNLGKEIFKEDIQNGRLNLYLDDSANMEKYLTSDDFNNKTIFFLDAHIHY